MSKSAEDKKAARIPGLVVRSFAFSAARGGGRSRRLKDALPSSTTPRADRTNLAELVRQGRRLRAVKDCARAGVEHVESLANYKPVSRHYEVSLSLSGEAGVAMSGLMTDLGVNSPNEVVKLTIALLVSARGKEILLRDLMTGTVEVVNLQPVG